MRFGFLRWLMPLVVCLTMLGGSPVLAEDPPLGAPDATETPTVVTEEPTAVPAEPTTAPTDVPTEAPPTDVPPTDVPTDQPTEVPPTAVPTIPPTATTEFEAAAPDGFVQIYVEKSVCGVEAGDARLGTADFFVLREPGAVAGAATCTFVEPDTETIDVTLSDGADYSETITISTDNGYGTFELAAPGTYTVTEQTGVDSYTSDPFVAADGEDIQVAILNYQQIEAPAPAFDPGATLYLQGSVVFCTSPDRSDVDFLIAEQSFDAVQGAGTAECEQTFGTSGPVELDYFGSGETPTDDPIATYGTVGSLGGSFQSTEPLPQGWYQVVYRTATFGGETYRSDMQAFDGYAAQVSIVSYVPVAESATDILVIKHFCLDPAREGEADFFVSSVPTGIGAAADSTHSCILVPYLGPEFIEFTLTDVETGEQASSTVIGFPFGAFVFPAVAPGTYTLTETIDGEVPTDITSESFTIAPGTGGVEIDVFNYVSDSGEGEFPTPEPGIETGFVLRTFVCLSDERPAGDVDFASSGVPFIPLGVEDSEIGAAATQECAAATDEAFAFTLSTVDVGEDDEAVVGQADYPLIRQSEESAVYGTDGSVPSGTYILREATTGFESAVFGIFPGFFNIGEFYLYQPFPTPTPTLTPTASPTLEPGVTPTATATLEPGVTPTADATNIVANPPIGAPGGPDDADGDGIPDDVDPDDDNDGTPDSEDPDAGDPGTGSSGGDVTQLPSTGQGQAASSSLMLVALLLAGVTLLGGAALRAGSRRR